MKGHGIDNIATYIHYQHRNMESYILFHFLQGLETFGVVIHAGSHINCHLTHNKNIQLKNNRRSHIGLFSEFWQDPLFISTKLYGYRHQQLYFFKTIYALLFLSKCFQHILSRQQGRGWWDRGGLILSHPLPSILTPVKSFTKLSLVLFETLSQ